MAQYYLIKEVKRGEDWRNDFGEYQSYSLVLDGVGEPVGLNRKKPVDYEHEPRAGEQLYGTVEMLMNKAGRAYNKFKTEKEPDDQQGPKTDSGGSYEAHGDKEDSIARAVALKAAVEYVIGNGDPKLEVLTVAEDYLSWLKNDSGSPAETASTTEPAPIKVEPSTPAAAKRDSPRDWSKVGQHDEEPLPQEPDDLSFLR